MNFDILQEWFEWLQHQVNKTMDWAAPYINNFLDGSKKVFIYVFENWQIVLAILLIIGIMRTVLSAVMNPFGTFGGRGGGGILALVELVGALMLFALLYFLFTGQISPPPT